MREKREKREEIMNGESIASHNVLKYDFLSIGRPGWIVNNNNNCKSTNCQVDNIKRDQIVANMPAYELDSMIRISPIFPLSVFIIYDSGFQLLLQQCIYYVYVCMYACF